MQHDKSTSMVLITGASTGIGRAIALHLAQQGYSVLAGVRSDLATQELRSHQLPNLIPVQLDVTNQESIRAAFSEVQRRVEAGQPLAALINNAAICVTGPLESLPLPELQEQFAVNLFGMVAVTQAALPWLLQSRGKIIQIGSNVGRLALPFIGPYAATKAALEALSDAWRRELQPLGVQVSLVAPGPVLTPVWDKIASAGEQRLQSVSPEIAQRYQARFRKFLRMNHDTARRSKLSSEQVAELVSRCLAASSPAPRYELGAEARLATLVSRVVPARWQDALIANIIRPRGSEAAEGRALDGIERMYYFFNQHCSNSVLALAELDGVLDPALIERAWPRVVQRHPFLQQRVQGEPLCFVSRAEVEGISVEPVAELAVRKLVERELNTALDPQRSLVRVVYAHDADRSVFIVSLLHIISDAKSAMIVLRDLLEELAQPGQGAATDAPALAPVSAESRLPARVRGWPGLPRMLEQQLLVGWQRLHKRPTRLPVERPVAFAARRNGYAQRLLAPNQVDALQRACREHHVSVHCALTAALVLALAEELGLRQTARNYVVVGSPVNLRQAYEPAASDELGSYVCTLGLCLNVGAGESLWSVAAQVKRELAEREARAEGLSALALVAHVSPSQLEGSGRMLRMIEQSGPGNVCISNLGELAFPERVLDLRVKAARWSAPLSITGYFLCAACTTSLGLALDYTYVLGIVSEARAQRIIEGMSLQLAGVINVGPRAPVRERAAFAEEIEA